MADQFERILDRKIGGTHLSDLFADENVEPPGAVLDEPVSVELMKEASTKLLPERQPFRGSALTSKEGWGRRLKKSVHSCDSPERIRQFHNLTLNCLRQMIEEQDCMPPVS